MSNIAQKLCKDLVDPVFGLSATCSYKRPLKKSVNYEDNEEKPIIEKRKLVNKILPQDAGKSKPQIINEFNSKERCLKNKLVDATINTIKSGPLKCDNNCITMVRKREKCNCKIGQKHSSLKTCAKQVQTVDKRNYLRTDKACEQCVDIVTLGTQCPYKFIQSNTGFSCPCNSHVKTKRSSHIKLECGSQLKSKYISQTKSELSNCIKSESSRLKTEDNCQIKWHITSQDNFISKQLAREFKPEKNNHIEKDFINLISQNSVYRENVPNSANRPYNFCYINGKRWALSQYPARGPDF